MEDPLLAVAGRAAVAELAYAGERYPEIEPVTPLVLGTRVCAALTYDRADLGAEIGASPAAALVLSDSRLALKGWESLAALGRPDWFLDPEGELFFQRLAEQELRKFPPSRLLLDTPLLRREYWWYLPRVIVRLNRVSSPVAIGRRRGPRDAVLVWGDGGRIGADSVRVERWDADPLALSSLGGRAGEWPEIAPATLMFHDFSVPDMERRAIQRTRGNLVSGRLEIAEVEGTRELPRPLGLLTRLRALKGLEDRCRSGLDRTAPRSSGS